ncbi:MAG: hypothetical protein KGM60_11855 [Comamonadaceae bacterium]|nr:hypothetical protein [Comamonadaceae bacterium]
MNILKAGLVYFLRVFGAGFALALVRVPFLVPRLGARNAELLETPIMLGVIIWASWRLADRHVELGRLARLLAGTVAFTLLVTAELLVAYALGMRSFGEYIGARDPVSGSIYAASLLVFALAPACWRNRPGPGKSAGLQNGTP